MFLYLDSFVVYHLDHSLVQPMQLLHLDICQKYLDLQAFSMAISSSFNWLCITLECSLMWTCSGLVLPFSLCLVRLTKNHTLIYNSFVYQTG